MSTVNERRKEILHLLEINKFLTIQEICAKVFSSPATIRRDLIFLEKSASIKRTRGGAVYINNPKEMPFELRENQNAKKKIQIADIAGELIKENDFIFLDSSTTCIKLAKRISAKQIKVENLKVLTNGIETVNILRKNNEVELYSTGGKVSSNTSSMLGKDAQDTIKDYVANVFFTSCRGLTEFGATDSSPAESEIKKSFTKNSQRTVLLVDSHKFNKAYSNISLDFQGIDYIISDQPLPKKVAAKVYEYNVHFIKV